MRTNGVWSDHNLLLRLEKKWRFICRMHTNVASHVPKKSRMVPLADAICTTYKSDMFDL